jgi:hypothetical protein
MRLEKGCAMSGSRKTSKRSPGSIGVEIKTELRNILHNLCELLRPINRFYTSPDRPVGGPRHFVCFDSAPHQEITGLRRSILQMSFPVETISDRVALLASSVWHLKDRLNHYAKSTKAAADSDVWANSNRTLQICGDIGNHKKHGHNQNRSGLNPELVPEISFDTSRSGLLEFYYDGATKQRELLVSNPVPIPYRVDVADGSGTVIGDATNIIRTGFDHWLPVIRSLGILAGTGRDDVALRDVLFPGEGL